MCSQAGVSTRPTAGDAAGGMAYNGMRSRGCCAVVAGYHSRLRLDCRANYQSVSFTIPIDPFLGNVTHLPPTQFRDPQIRIGGT